MNSKNVILWLTALAWVFVDGLVLYWGLRPRAKYLQGLVLAMLTGLFLIVAIGLMVAGPGFVFIGPDDRGVVISALESQGYQSEALQPGLHWIVPFVETVAVYPVSPQTYVMMASKPGDQFIGDDSVPAKTSDGQQVYVDVVVTYALDPARVIDVHIAWQNRYPDSVVRPLARSIARDVIAQFPLSGITMSTGHELEEEISRTLRQELEEQGIVLVNLILPNIYAEDHTPVLQQAEVFEPATETQSYVNLTTVAERLASYLLGIACFAFPVSIAVALLIRSRRKETTPPLTFQTAQAPLESHQSPAPVGPPLEVPTDPQAAFDLGQSLLLEGKRAEAKACFMQAFRTGVPDLRQRAINELEKLGEVESQ